MPPWLSWSGRGLMAATTGFCVLEHRLWSAITTSGEVLTGNTPDGLDQQIRAHWQALQ